jgi:hypothetical protein
MLISRQSHLERRGPDTESVLFKSSEILPDKTDLRL